MRARIHLPRGIHYYADALEGLVRVNADLYREDKSLPSIYDAGVRYKGRDPDEDWRNAREVVSERFGDCEDLAAARAGELRAKGDLAARADVIRTGPKMTHAIVIHGDGVPEDPSRLLGMGKHRQGRREQIGGSDMGHEYPGYDDWDNDESAGASFALSPTRKAIVKAVKPAPKPAVERPVSYAAQLAPLQSPLPAALTTSYAEPYAPDDSPLEPRTYREPYEVSDTGMSDYGDEEEGDSWQLSQEDWDQIGDDPSDSAELSWTVDRTPTGWRGIVRVPLAGARALFVARGGATPEEAKSRALTSASNVLDSSLAKTLIPPQALAALKVLKSPTAQKAAKVAFEAAKKLKFW